METWKPSISANLFVEYKLNDKSAFGLGLGYQNNGTKTKKLDLVYNVDPNTGKPIKDPNEPSQGMFIYNHHNIEIPLYYKHTFGKRFYYLVGVSGIINVLNTTKSIKYFDNKPTERRTEKDNSTHFRRFNVYVNGGIGITYFRNDQLSLFVHPKVQFGLLGVSKNASLNRNILSLGITTGIRI